MSHRARRFSRGALAMMVGVFGLWAVGLAGSAAALPAGCVQSGAMVTCSYAGAGTYAFIVPAGLSSVQVTAVGAAGGSYDNGSTVLTPGGLGASVEDRSVPVSQGVNLSVVVGAVGSSTVYTGGTVAGGAGGSPGGGAGSSSAGAGGGGYSGVLDRATAPAKVLVIAGGGGGAGGGANGRGGNGGRPNGGSGKDSQFGRGGGGGGGGITVGASPGGGFLGPGAAGGGDGSPGSSLSGGQGGSATGGGGGGGGGGYYGGGGGGGCPYCGGGGGGGGSSYGITGLANETSSSAAASVTISYRLTPVVFAGYADGFRQGKVSAPTPWQGTPGVIFEGCNYFQPDRCPKTKSGAERYDSGTIRIDNTTGQTLTITNASVAVGSCSFDPWPGLHVTLPVGKQLILTQTGGTAPCHTTGGNFNFDTSETNHGCTSDHLIPAVNLSVDGTAEGFVDRSRILNTGGIDLGAKACASRNETHPWGKIFP